MQILSYQDWEASQKDFPHIHVLMLFHDHSFKITLANEKDQLRFQTGLQDSGEGRVREELAQLCGCSSHKKMDEGIAYVTMYMAKSKSSIQRHTRNGLKRSDNEEHS